MSDLSAYVRPLQVFERTITILRRRAYVRACVPPRRVRVPTGCCVRAYNLYVRLPNTTE